MGDRANVVIKDSHQAAELFLYTHWCGHELPGVVAAAIKRGKSRWDDPQYFARIVFCEMLKLGGGLDGETGFGISTSVGDNSYKYIVLDMDKQEVRFEDPESRAVVGGAIPFAMVEANGLKWPSL